MSDQISPSAPTPKSERSVWVTLSVFLLLAVGLLMTLRVEEDWRGMRAWAAAKRGLEAKGESLDWSAFIPPPVPPDENLAMAPLFVRALDYRVDSTTHVFTFGTPYSDPVGKELENMPFAGPRPEHSVFSASGWRMARHINLAEYQTFYRASADFTHAAQSQSPGADVLLALERYAPILDELAREAAKRPRTQYPIDWYPKDAQNIYQAQYLMEQQLIKVLRLRGTARLAVGQHAPALLDMETAFRLCHCEEGNPTLLNNLVQMLSLDMALNSVWEGLADRHWSAEELIQLQTGLQQFDLLKDFHHAVRGERASLLQSIDWFREHPGETWSTIELLQSTGYPRRQDPVVWLGASLLPRGWYDLNKTTVAQFIQDYTLPTVDPQAHRVFPSKIADSRRVLDGMSTSPSNAIARLALMGMYDINFRPAMAQTGLDEAMTACALERFFLEHKSYPARLAELVPAYLKRVPNDLMDGAPLRYRLTPDGRYQLYSIGWDARDDGGKVVWSNKDRLSDREGDWVWQYGEVDPPPPTGP